MSTPIGILRELPCELAYLAEPAMRFGVYQFDNDIDRFLAHANDTELSQLAAIAERVRLNDHFPVVNDWLNDHEIDKHAEAANLYFLFGLMDAADMTFEAV